MQSPRPDDLVGFPITNHLSVVKKNHGPGVSSSCVSGKKTLNLRQVSRGRMSLDEPQSRRFMRHLMLFSQDFDKNADASRFEEFTSNLTCVLGVIKRLVFLDMVSLGMLLGWTYFSTLWGVTPKHLTFFSTRNRWKSMPLHSLIPKNLGKLGVCFFFSKKSATGKC